MHSMMQQPPIVIGGVDAHAETHHFAVLDARGALLGSVSFSASTAGYAEALRWLESHGRVDGVAVESTGSYAAGMVRYLRTQLIGVVEVNKPHPHTRRRVGKRTRSTPRWRPDSCWLALRPWCPKRPLASWKRSICCASPGRAPSRHEPPRHCRSAI